MLDFAEYSQHTRRTAEYPEDTAILYLALGLADEAGEFTEEVTKSPTQDEVEEMRAEMGDVFWYVSELIRHLADDPGQWKEGSGRVQADWTGVISTRRSMDPEFGEECAQEALQRAAQVAGQAKKAIRDDDGKFTDERSERILRLVTEIRRNLDKAAHHLGLGGHEIVLEENLDKLLDRKDKGLIKGEGEGDERVSTA